MTALRRTGVRGSCNLAFLCFVPDRTRRPRPSEADLVELTWLYRQGGVRQALRAFDAKEQLLDWKERFKLEQSLSSHRAETSQRACRR